MTTTASHSQISTSKPQKRLFHSLSRFLSGKSRPKLVGTSNNNGGRNLKGTNNVSTNLNNNNFNNNNNNNNYNNNFLRDNTDELPLREVINRRSTINSFTSSSIGTREERILGDGASEISGISSLGNSGSRREDDGGADTDASIRPISPGSLAPSSILSRETSASNISYAPTHGTYASTKPTTIFSVESGTGGNVGGTGGSTGGANRIAVVPGTGAGGMALPNSLTNHSASPPSISSQQGINLTSNNSSNSNNPGITFSTSPNTNSTTSTSTGFNPNSNSPYNSRLSPGTTDQAPRFTTAHPRNNPHPASPPPDNASMLTLASSSFAPSFAPSRYTSGGGGGASLSGLRARIEADEDASVRALAPSRRASDESLGSRSTWSAAIGNNDGRKEVTASLRTVGTGGTGGELLGIGERSTSTGNEREGLSDVEGVETEAQKVVRTEGGDKMKLELGERVGGKEIMLEGEHQLTPTGEIDSVLPILGESVATISPNQIEEPLSNHSEVSTPSSDPTPPTSSLHLPFF